MISHLCRWFLSDLPQEEENVEDTVEMGRWGQWRGQHKHRYREECLVG